MAGQCKLSIIAAQNANLRGTRHGRRCRCAAEPGTAAARPAAGADLPSTHEKSGRKGRFFSLAERLVASLVLAVGVACEKSGRKGRFFSLAEKLLASLVLAVGVACEKSGRKGRFFSLAEKLLASLVLAVGELLADPRRFARTVAQVVELGAPHVPFALDLDAGDQRRIRLE